MAIFSGNSSNFPNSDNKVTTVKLELLKSAARDLIVSLDTSEMEGTWEGGSWVLPETTSDRIDGYKDALRNVLSELG